MKNQRTGNLTSISTALLLSLGLVSSVQAEVYTFDIDNPRGSDRAGDITNITTSYDSGSEVLNWQSTISPSGGNLADGFWLVVSGGANPKSHYNEYAIFYGDSNTGNLSAYVYNGVNSSNSWNTPGEFIQTFGGAFESETSIAGDVTFNFSIDVSGINSYVPTTPGTNAWEGAQYGEKVGIWYHPVVFNDSPTYNEDGSLSSFSYGRSGWYDTGNQLTVVTDVPEPGTLALASFGLIGMFVGRKRRNNKAVA